MAGPVLTLHSGKYARGVRQAPHSHDELHLSMVLRGRVVERVGSGTEYGRALSISAKDPSVVHADEFGEDGTILARLSISDRGLASLLDDSRRSAEWRWTHDASVAAPFLRIVARGLCGESGFATDDSDVADLVAGFTARPVRACGDPPAWLRQAMDRMRDDHSTALTVRDVAEGAGVHPVYLARCVRRWYGVAAADVLRRTRLLRAADALAAPERTVSVAAHTAGFADEPHLCRAFVRVTGVTPGRYRKMVRGMEAGRA